jgi:hypothetical protein
MPTWGWVLVAIAVIVVVALVLWQLTARRKTSHLRERFGPEYDRALRERDDQKEAEKELAAREERREKLDDPAGAVASADALIQAVMAERGYPVEDFEQRAADMSVDHPQVVEHYRQGHRLSTTHGDDTEQLRQAMRHYRALFEELVEPTADEPMAREPATTDERTVQRR